MKRDYFKNGMRNDSKRKNERQVPLVTEIIQKRAWAKSGLVVIARNYWRLAVEIDENEILEADLDRLFSAPYRKFSFSKRMDTSDAGLKNVAKFYFPLEMLKNHKLKVSYRSLSEKMIRTVIDMTVSDLEKTTWEIRVPKRNDSGGKLEGEYDVYQTKAECTKATGIIFPKSEGEGNNSLGKDDGIEIGLGVSESIQENKQDGNNVRRKRKQEEQPSNENTIKS
ncbi:hypothetical protein [Paenibacillus marinisediminis]